MRYPEAAEAIAHGRFGYLAGSRRPAIVGTAHRDGGAVAFIPNQPEREALAERDVFVPPDEGASSWLAIRSEAAAGLWDLGEELWDASYRRVALVRLVRALDGHPAVPTTESCGVSHGRATLES